MAKKAKKEAIKLSPLLRSAFEVLDHGLYHFLRSNTAKDMKFALLHGFTPPAAMPRSTTVWV